MSSMRRALVVVMAIGVAGSAALFHAAVTAGEENPPLIAQKAERKPVLETPTATAPGVGPALPAPDADPDLSKDPSFSDGLTLPVDRKATWGLSLAEDFIKENDWSGAAGALQKLLERDEDLPVEVHRKGPDGKDASRWTSLRDEANRLIGTMPPEGLEVYELRFGHDAKKLLTEAKTKNDPELLARVATRFLHTEAGAEAVNLLGTYYLDRGNFANAARSFEWLLGLPHPDKLTPITFVKATLAFRRANDKAGADQAWKQLAALHPEGVRLGDRTVSLEMLQQEMDRIGSGQTGTSTDWLLVRGNPSRSAQSNGGSPYLDDVLWKPQETAKQTQTKQWIEQALQNQEGHQQKPILPAFAPLTATVQTDKGPVALLIYRSYGCLNAIDLRNGDIFWQTLPLTWSIDTLVANTTDNKLATLNQWLPLYQQAGGLSILYENSTLGALSSDGNRVYLVDDLALPPHPAYLQQFAWGGMPQFNALKDGVNCNLLQAYNLETGKILWTLGGPDDKNPLGDSYFLGPPLPLGGKLYVLNQKQTELRLLCLNPSGEELKPPTVAWVQTLANVREGLVNDVGRRIQAAPLAYGEGLLVCPTNSGAIMGVDLLSHSLVWAHAYRQPQPIDPKMEQMRMRGMMMANQQQSITSDWKACTPIIAEGKVVFTAPDGTGIHCLNLRDGTPLWTAERADDLYLGGVYNGRVLLVGKASCRALALADGKQLWRQETGLPSGLGVASKNVYYLPLKTGKDKEPEVCALDIDTGKDLSHSKSRKKDHMEVPGNLLFFEGDVVSQTVSAVTVYPQLDVKLAKIDEALKNNPKDPVGLTERGQMRLDKGDLAGAVDDLRTALANQPPTEVLPKTRAKLFETLTELFQRDFDASEKFLEEYRSMCLVPVPEGASPDKRKELEEEQQRRQANFLCLLAKGREKQGRLREAFQAYVDFGALNGNRERVTVVDEPTIQARPDVWAQGRIAAMIAHATPEQRQPLETTISQQWRALQDTQDIDALRHFVALFGSLFRVGKEARLELAERLMDDKGDRAFVEAELTLQPLLRQEDLQLAARAYETLARLSIRKGLLPDAAYYYRILGTQFGQILVRDGKTGADLLNDLATDKRFLPYLDEPRQPWGDGKEARLKAREVPGSSNPMRQTYVFEPEGELLPFFQRNRLALINNTELKLIDRWTGDEPWTFPLTVNNPQFQQYLQYLYSNPNLRFPFHTKGHLVVMNLGPWIYGIDPVGHKVLWEKNLLGNGGLQPNNYVPDTDGGLQALYPDGFTQKLGKTGPAEASYVCLQTRQGLETLDPLTGTVLWTKSGDVNPRYQIFGDEQNLYLLEVQPNGQVGIGKALRACDGVSVPIPDFAAAYQKKVRIQGRNLLVADHGTQGNLLLRLYDVQTGLDLWKKEFSPKARVIHTDEEDLTGVIEPDNQGKVTVLDLRSGKEVLAANTDIPEHPCPKDMDKWPEDGIHGVSLVQDNDLIYVIFNAPPDPVANPFGGPWSNFTSAGIRMLTVNGNVYAFERHPQESARALRWIVEAPTQFLVLDQFKDLPALLFTARYQKINNVGGVNRGMFQVAATKSIDKRTGKLLYDKEATNGNQFYALNVDPRARTIDLVTYNMKVQVYVEPRNSPEKKEKSAPPPVEGKTE